MKIKLMGVGIVAMATLASASAYAGQLKFKIENSSNYIISSFQTNEGSGWSKNWLSGEIHGGEATNMKFFEDGPCQVQVRVGWRTTDGGQEVGEPWNIDICDAKVVYFDGNKVTYE